MLAKHYITENFKQFFNNLVFLQFSLFCTDIFRKSIAVLKKRMYFQERPPICTTKTVITLLKDAKVAKLSKKNLHVHIIQK